VIQEIGPPWVLDVIGLASRGGIRYPACAMVANKWILTMCVCLSGQAGALAAGADDGMPGFFRDWIAAQKKAPDLRVEFTITKTMPALKEPVKLVGRFWSYADGRFRWETGRPATSILVYDGATMQSWEAAENHWRKLDPKSRGMRLWMDFLGGQKLTEADLLKDFLITAPAAGKSLASVTLEPRSARVKRDVPGIDLKFNLGERRLVQMFIRQGDGGSQQMDFGEPKRMTAADRAVVPPPAPK